MQKELITNKQGIAMIAFFIIGSTLVVGVGVGAKQDAWFATILAALAALPMILIYARILSLYPEKNAYDIMTMLFGKIFSKILAILFIWYSLFLGALIFRNFLEITTVVALPETPEYIIGIFLVILVIWAVKEGIEVLGRFANFTIIYVVLILLIVSALSFPLGSIDNLRPFLMNGMGPVINSAFGTFAFPFAETVCFLFALSITKENKPYRMFSWGWAIGAFFIVLISIRNLLVLGPNFLEHVYFPSHVVISLINIGDFLQRIEVTVTIVFFFGGFIKSGVCILSACNGLKSLFHLDSYRFLVVPAAMFAFIMSLFIYENTQQMYEFTHVYPYFAFPFQVILPVIIWIAAEIKARMNKTKAKASGQMEQDRSGI